MTREFFVSDSPSEGNGGECGNPQDVIIDCDICRGPEIYGQMPSVIDAEYWRVELNPNQQLIGRTFVGLKHHVSRMGGLTRDEVLEHHEIVSKLDVAARRAFGASMINLLTLMNDSVGKGQEPHIHSHVIPRYEHPFTLGDHTFVDINYGKHYNSGGKSIYKPSVEEIEAITQEMRQYID